MEKKNYSAKEEISRKDDRGSGNRQKYVEKDKNSQFIEKTSQGTVDRMTSPKSYKSIKNVKSPKKYVEKEKLEPPTNIRSAKSAILEELNYPEIKKE